jgi:hypothetical protein
MCPYVSAWFTMHHAHSLYASVKRTERVETTDPAGAQYHCLLPCGSTPRPFTPAALPLCTLNSTLQQQLYMRHSRKFGLLELCGVTNSSTNSKMPTCIVYTRFPRLCRISSSGRKRSFCISCHCRVVLSSQELGFRHIDPKIKKKCA